MKTMRKVLMALVAILSMYAGEAAAQAVYQSPNNGLRVTVPQGTQVVKDEPMLLHLSHPNGLVFSAHPMYTENLTADALVEGMSKVAKEYGFELSQAQEEDFSTGTLDGVFYCYIVNDVLCCVGMAEIKGDDSLCFMFTLTGNEATGEACHTLIKTLEFKIDAIKE